MALSITTHLNFAGDAREALEFYQGVFGGELTIGTYRDGGVPVDDPTGDEVRFAPVEADSPDADRVAFGLLVGANGFRLAAYDVVGRSDGGSAGVQGHSRRADGLTHDESLFVVLNGGSLDESRGVWERLTVGGTIIQALAATPWGAPYGMATDRFGVTWIVGVDPR